MQDALGASVGTLWEIHNVSVPLLPSRDGSIVPQPRPSLERFVNLREVTIDEMHLVRESCLPALPVGVRMVTLDVGRRTVGCGSYSTETCIKACRSPQHARSICMNKSRGLRGQSSRHAPHGQVRWLKRAAAPPLRFDAVCAEAPQRVCFQE